MIERYIYIGDIHWNEWFVDFVKKYNNWKTFFISTWDLFDRGRDSFWVFSTIKELYEKGLFEMVFWNHDLFFIIPNIYPEHPDSHIFLNQFEYNGWNKTMDSFIENLLGISISERWANPLSLKLKRGELNDKLFWITKWLFDKFNIYYIDPLKNIVIHWWIPITFDWDIIWENINWKFVSWLDYIKLLNEWLKNKDFQTIKKLTALYPADKILFDCKKEYWWTYIYEEFKEYDNYLPTWFNNQIYKESEKSMNWLRKELDKFWLNRLISGHICNTNNNFGKEDNQDTFLQLDRSFVYSKKNFMRKWIWYAILNTKNEIIEIWTY